MKVAKLYLQVTEFVLNQKATNLSEETTYKLLGIFII